VFAPNAPQRILKSLQRRAVDVSRVIHHSSRRSQQLLGFAELNGEARISWQFADVEVPSGPSCRLATPTGVAD
jgi:hypothetical protein